MKRYIIVILTALMAVCAHAQTRISGTVTDQQGEPLIGATVSTAGGGAVTDLEGRYSITARLRCCKEERPHQFHINCKRKPDHGSNHRKSYGCAPG